MPRPSTPKSDAATETWEATTAATTWVYTFDKREDRYKLTRVGGRSGSRRLMISRDDRKYNQEILPYENTSQDPFTNGTLRLVSDRSLDDELDTRYHYTDADIAAFYEVREADAFLEAISDITSELVLRRIAAFGDTSGTIAQLEAIRGLLRERYPVGGTQKSVQEMIDAGDRLGVGQL